MKLRYLGGALLIPVALYGAVLAYVYSTQRSMLFYPSHDYVSPARAFADPALREMPVRTADGLALIGWYAPATTKRLTLVFFHGNGGNLLREVRHADPYIHAGYGFLATEYRGYSGLPGTPSEAGLYDDARAYIRALIASGVREQDIVLFGHSLGTGVAAQMATEFHVGGLILLSPFRSLVDVAAEEYPLLPARLMLKDRFETDRKIKSITAPLLIAHGAQDQMIASSQGRGLFAMANEPKQFYLAPGGGHNDMFGNGFAEASLKWLDGLNGAGGR